MKEKKISVNIFLMMKYFLTLNYIREETYWHRYLLVFDSKHKKSFRAYKGKGNFTFRKTTGSIAESP